MAIVGLCFIGSAYLLAHYQNTFDDKFALGLIILVLVFTGVMLNLVKIKDFYIHKKYTKALDHFRLRELQRKFPNEHICPCGDIKCEEDPKTWPYSHIH